MTMLHHAEDNQLMLIRFQNGRTRIRNENEVEHHIHYGIISLIEMSID